jgi:hypothetical protein
MKKQLDTDAVMSELKAGSAFFKQPEPFVENELAYPIQVKRIVHIPTIDGTAAPHTPTTQSGFDR